MRVGTGTGGRAWVTMGPVGWMTVGVFVLLPYYATKYTLVAMWWVFVLGPWKLYQLVQERRAR